MVREHFYIEMNIFINFCITFMIIIHYTVYFSNEHITFNAIQMADSLAFLNKIPDQCGYLVISDGAVLKVCSLLELLYKHL